MSDDPTLLDTNVLIYASDPLSQYHLPCARLLDRARSGDAGLCVAPQVLAEFFAVVTDPRRTPVVRSPLEAVAAIRTIVAAPGITVLPTPR